MAHAKPTNEEDLRREIVRRLGPASTARGCSLDFDSAFGAKPVPPLDVPDSTVGQIYSSGAFGQIAEGWAEWLLEAGRLLAEDGIAVVGLAPEQRFERLTGAVWDEALIGMTVLDDLDETGRTVVFHSEWWLRSHWGRAFERVEVQESDGLRHVLLSRPVDGITAEQLELPAESDERELAAAIANAGYLRFQVDLLARRHRHELAELREETGRELMRRSFAAADLEWARRGPGSPATLAAAEYEATTSWRVTRPLRALGAMVRRLR